MPHKISRRRLLQVGAAAGAALLVKGHPLMAEDTHTTPNEANLPKQMKVAAVQLRSTRDLGENVKKHCEHIRKLGADGVRVLAFPECSLTGYFDEAVEKATPAQLAEAEDTVCDATKDAGVYAIVGGVTKTGDITYNSALVFTPQGTIIERYHKVQLAGEKWATPGDHMSVFPIDDTFGSIIICHDERYPELVRLPVLAGARIVFYISSESGIVEEQKIGPYRAQICARAAENCVHIVHANTPADPKTMEGSHGQSRIIKSNGNIVCEGSIFGEDVLTAELDLRGANGYFATQSMNCKFLKDWWEAGVSRVKRIG